MALSLFQKLKKIQDFENNVIKLENEINLKTKELNDILYSLQSNRSKLTQISSEINTKEKELNDCKKELGLAQGIIEIQDMGLNLSYTPTCSDSLRTSEELEKVRNEMADMIYYEQLVQINQEYLLDNSLSKGKAFQKSFSDGVIIGFNTYFEKKRKSVTTGNFNKTVELIKKKFASYNNKANIMGISISAKYCDLCIKLLQLELDDKIVKDKEKEKVREEKRKLKEQEKLLVEAEKERKRLENERANLQKLFAKAVTEQEQNEINAKLAKVDSRIEEVDWRVSHYSAGWLYITTTPSMPGIMKIGCTRQLNPLNRLAQLSSASVPFPFECRGLVFSEDVFALEAKMHNRLDSKRVNKNNKLKEFFYGEPEEVIKILTDELHEAVRFIDEHWVGNGKENDNEEEE